MSRLGAALRPHDSHERRYVPQRLNFASFTEEYTRLVAEQAVVYRIDSTFRAQVTVADSAGPGALADAVERAKRMVTREVFGEFVAPLHEALYALDNLDTKQARALIQKVLAAFDSNEPLKTAP